MTKLSNLFLFLLVAGFAPSVDAFAAVRPEQTKKVVIKNPAAEKAERHTNRPEVPGRHRQGAWYQPEKAKKDKEDSNSSQEKEPKGRAWSFGKVSWW